MNKEIIKLCPYLPVTEVRKAVFVGNGDFTVTYFNPCLKEACMAYVKCQCANIKNM